MLPILEAPPGGAGLDRHIICWWATTLGLCTAVHDAGGWDMRWCTQEYLTVSYSTLCHLVPAFHLFRFKIFKDDLSISPCFNGQCLVPHIVPHSVPGCSGPPLEVWRTTRPHQQHGEEWDQHGDHWDGWKVPAMMWLRQSHRFFCFHSHIMPHHATSATRMDAHCCPLLSLHFFYIFYHILLPPRNISLETHKAQSTTALSRMAGLGGLRGLEIYPGTISTCWKSFWTIADNTPFFVHLKLCPPGTRWF